MDVTELWRPLIPIQAIGLVLMIVLAIVLGYREKKRITKEYGSIAAAAAIEPDLQIGKETSESIKTEPAPPQSKKIMDKRYFNNCGYRYISLGSHTSRACIYDWGKFSVTN
jgi:Mg2+/citrate symporter